MPIGDYTNILYDSRAARFIVRVLGTPDLHAHFRIAPLLDFFKRHVAPNEPVSILEVGCGSGLNLFELCKLADINAVGYDLNPDAIEAANKITQSYCPDRVAFFCQDAASIVETRTYDYLVLMDFLEHVEGPGRLLKKLDAYLKEDGCILISVPTPRYPRVFGEQFHRSIGHVVDGYRLPDLDQLLPVHYERLTYQYNTGLCASLGCALFYRFVRTIKNRYVRWALGTLLLPFKWFDVINNERISCSLFAAYRKVDASSSIRFRSASAVVELRRPG